MPWYPNIPSPGKPLDSDVQCVGCGYNLRGLKRIGRCPECGLEIRESLDVHRELPFPARRPLFQGLVLMGVSLLMSTFTAAVLAAMWADLTHSNPLIAWEIVWSLLPWWVLASHAVWLAGVWRATAPATRSSIWRFQGHLAIRICSGINAAAWFFLYISVASNILIMRADAKFWIALASVPFIILTWFFVQIQTETLVMEITWRARAMTNEAERAGKIVRGLIVAQFLATLPPCCFFGIFFYLAPFVPAAPTLILALMQPYLALLLFRLAARIRQRIEISPP